MRRAVTVITVLSVVDYPILLATVLASLLSFWYPWPILQNGWMLYGGYNFALRLFSARYYRYRDLDLPVSDSWLQRLGFQQREGDHPGVLSLGPVTTWASFDGLSRWWQIDVPGNSWLIPEPLRPSNRAEALTMFSKLGLKVPRGQQIQS